MKSIFNYLCTCCLYGAVCNGFEVGKDPLRDALKFETFLGPEMATSEASAIWAQQSRVCSQFCEDFLFVENLRKKNMDRTEKCGGFRKCLDNLLLQKKLVLNEI